MRLWRARACKNALITEKFVKIYLFQWETINLATVEYESIFTWFLVFIRTLDAISLDVMCRIAKVINNVYYERSADLCSTTGTGKKRVRFVELAQCEWTNVGSTTFTTSRFWMDATAADIALALLPNEANDDGDDDDDYGGSNGKSSNRANHIKSPPIFHTDIHTQTSNDTRSLNQIHFHLNSVGSGILSGLLYVCVCKCAWVCCVYMWKKLRHSFLCIWRKASEDTNEALNSLFRTVAPSQSSQLHVWHCWTFFIRFFYSLFLSSAVYNVFLERIAFDLNMNFITNSIDVNWMNFLFAYIYFCSRSFAITSNCEKQLPIRRRTVKHFQMTRWLFFAHQNYLNAIKTK